MQTNFKKVEDCIFNRGGLDIYFPASHVILSFYMIENRGMSHDKRNCIWQGRHTALLRRVLGSCGKGSNWGSAKNSSSLFAAYSNTAWCHGVWRRWAPMRQWAMLSIPLTISSRECVMAFSRLSAIAEERETAHRRGGRSQAQGGCWNAFRWFVSSWPRRSSDFSPEFWAYLRMPRRWCAEGFFFVQFLIPWRQRSSSFASIYYATGKRGTFQPFGLPWPLGVYPVVFVAVKQALEGRWSMWASLPAVQMALTLIGGAILLKNYKFTKENWKSGILYIHWWKFEHLLPCNAMI